MQLAANYAMNLNELQLQFYADLKSSYVFPIKLKFSAGRILRLTAQWLSVSTV